MKQSNYPQATLLALALCCCAFTACEKPFNGESQEEVTTKGDKVKITFRSLSTNQASFNTDGTQNSRAVTATPITDICNRISLAIFDSDSGDKVASLNQEKGDKSFGNITVNLAKGRYLLTVIAHNGEGNATISSPSKITFKDNKVTDTFYYYGEFDATDAANYDLTMKRAVAMFRLVMKDHTPQAVHNIKFYYTGGSSTFDSTTGYGCVNSNQTEMRATASTAYSSESTYDIYTFPHEDARKLKIDVSALENATATQALYKRTFENVAIERNHITRYSGFFYGETPETGRNFGMTTTDEWEYDDYEY